MMGQGGAGAGGTIILQIDNFSLTASCPLIVRANGANGGTVNSSTHGGGGAGGQGAIFASASAQPSNSTFQTLNGNPGCNNNSVPCNNLAGSASGVNNSGIFFLGHGTPLPVSSWNFTASFIQNDQPFVSLSWQNDNLQNSGKFKVLKSYDLNTWLILFDNILTDNPNQIATFERIDENLNLKNYYQLVFEDFNGNIIRSETQEVLLENAEKFYPNPFENEFSIESIVPIAQIEVYNELGQKVFAQPINAQSVQMKTQEWNSGFYFVKVFYNYGDFKIFKVIKN